MDKSISPRTALVIGIIIGAAAVVILNALGFKLEEVGLGPFKFTASTTTPTTTLQAATRTPLLPASTSATTPPPTPLSKLGQELLALIETESDAYKNKDVSRVLPLFAQDAIIMNVQSREVWSGIDRIAFKYDSAAACCFILENTYEINDIKQSTDNPDKVIVKLKHRGRVVDMTTNKIVESPSTQQLWSFAKVSGRWKIVALIDDIPD